MECLIHSPAFNCVKMAWVAGVGRTHPVERSSTTAGAETASSPRCRMAARKFSVFLAGPGGGRAEGRGRACFRDVLSKFRTFTFSNVL